MLRSHGKFLLLATVAAGLVMLGARAEAAGMSTTKSLRPAVDAINLTISAQMVMYYQGRRYCWYDDGWRGPGWYYCGYAWRRGIGWGGPIGWMGWQHHGPPPPMWGPGPMGGPPPMMGFPPPPMMGFPPPPMMGFPPPPMMGFPPPPMMGFPPPPMMGFPPPPPMMSDIRAKHDIARLGSLDNGLGFYRFAYIGSDQAYVGVMAQEVEAVMPEAVVRGSDGYLRVDYHKLGFAMQTWEDWVASGRTIPASVH